MHHDIPYTVSPQKFVAVLKERGERLYVANRSCVECHLTPGHSIPSSVITEMIAVTLKQNRIPECICASIARYQQRAGVPESFYCYGFFYLYWHTHPILRAAHDADLIEFLDITGLPGIRESGLLFHHWE